MHVLVDDNYNNMNEKEQPLTESSKGLKPLLTSFNEYAQKN